MNDTPSSQFLQDHNGLTAGYRSLIRKARDALFHLCYLCCPNPNLEHRNQSARTDFALYALLVALKAMQILSLVYPADSIMRQWERYSLWMTLVALFRFDVAAVHLGFQSAFFYFASALAGLPTLLYLTQLRSLQRKPKRAWNTWRFLFKVAIRVQAGPLFLPSLCSFLAAIKYTEERGMVEYSDAEAQVLLSPGVHYAAVLPLALLLVNSAVAHLLLYDMFLPNAKHHLESRAHSKAELLSLFCQSSASLSRFLIPTHSFLLHYFLCASLGGTMIYHYFYYLPFYNLVVNWLNVMVFFVGAWGSVALVLSYAVDSAACGFVFTLLFPLAVGPILWDLLKRRVAYIQRTYTSQFVSLRNLYLGELCIRYSILRHIAVNPTKTDESLYEFYITSLAPLFNRHTTLFAGSMFPALWEFGYVYSVVQDANIARVKLTKSAGGAFDLEGAFNQYRFQQVLSEDLKQASEEAVYVSFRIQFDEAKKADEDSCRMQLLFWSELSSQSPQTKRAESLARRINESLRSAKLRLSKLVQTYPKSHLALRLYGSYLTDVINDTERGRELINKSLYEESELSVRNQLLEGRFSYFDDSNGIMLISASSDTVGTITYINQRAGEVLGVSERMAAGMNIAHFIPATICNEKAHNEALLRFIRYCTTDNIQVPFGFFVQDASEFIVDVKLQMKPTSLDLKPYFLVAIKRELPGVREICLIDDSGVVRTNTRGFPVLVGYSDSPLLCKSLSADSLLEHYSDYVAPKPANEVFLYTLPGTINQVTMKFVAVRIANTAFRMLYASVNSEEIDRWVGMSEKSPAQVQDYERNASIVKRRRTLKSILRKEFAVGKELQVRLDLNPRVVELTETDFPAGYSEYGKAKDAPVIDPTLVPPADDHSERGEFNSEDRRHTQVLDLKDLEGIIRSGRSDMSDQSKVSAAILSELTDGKRRGQSLASSAVSSNSSFSNTKTAMDLLKVVNSSMKRFKYSFLFTNLAVILGVMAMLIYLIVSADAYQDRLIIPQLCDRRELTSLLAFDARNLHLVYTGYFSRDRETLFRARMQGNLALFDSVMQELTDLVDGFPRGQYKDLYLEEEIQTWEVSAGVISSSRSNLLNVMRKLSLSAHSILEAPLPLLNTSHPGVYFLFQNGEGEALQVMNESTWVFISQEQSEFASVLRAIGIMGVMAFLLLVACCLIVIVPTVISVDKSNQNIWGFFYKLPFDIVQDLRFHCEERLESVHSIDVQQCSPRKVSTAEMKERSLIQCSRKWPYVFRRLWIYYSLSIAYGLYFYFAVYSNLAALLLLDPEVVNLVGERTLAIQSTYLWLQETRLSSSDYAHTFPWSSSSYWPSSHQRLSSLLSRLSAIELEIITGRRGADSYNDAQSVSSACGIVSDCGETVLSRGTHDSVLRYLQDAEYYASIPAGTALPEELEELRALLHNATSHQMTDYAAVISSKIAAVELEIELITILYCSICLLFYFFVYLPMTSQVRKQLTNIWDLASLIPTEFNERIMRALKKADTSKT